MKIINWNGINKMKKNCSFLLLDGAASKYGGKIRKNLLNVFFQIEEKKSYKI
jgi:hypothetical protein